MKVGCVNIEARSNMETSGTQFLHKRDSKLHATGPVEHEKERKKIRGEKVSQKPVEKIFGWLEVIEKTHMGHRDDPRVLARIKNFNYLGFVRGMKHLMQLALFLGKSGLVQKRADKALMFFVIVFGK